MKINPTELLANYFVSYLFEKYRGTLHVRRVASWIGFIIMGLAKVRGATISKRHSRQIRFEYKNHKFKVRYNHTVGNRGGLEIAEILPGRGAPEGRVIARITNLSEAERAYHSLPQQLNKFVASKHKQNHESY